MPAGQFSKDPAIDSALRHSVRDGMAYTVQVGAGETYFSAFALFLRATAPQVALKVGERVIVPLEMPMQNFHSQSLNRDFPLIYFVSQIRREGEAVHGTSTAQPAERIDAMSAPSGGMTIADLWSKRQSLAGKSVTVHGKVVKFNSGILGRNWIHLQDGTGKSSDNSNDITITTSEDIVVKVGDTITITGTVAIDKDFGTLAKGKAADLLVLEKNPLANITNMRSIQLIYLGGRKFE